MEELAQNALQIYLSPIPIRLPNSTNSNTNFQSCHKIIFLKEKIDYIFDSNTVDDHKLPEWRVLNPFFNITNNNENYVLNNFHVHYPAEHTINNKRYPLEIHFVFMDLNGSENALVVGYIFKIGKRSSTLIKNIMAGKPLEFPSILDNNFCTYNGSLTKINLEDIEPLAVNWNLVTKFKTITNEDLELLIKHNMTRGASIIRPNNGRNVTFVHKCCKK